VIQLAALIRRGPGAPVIVIVVVVLRPVILPMFGVQRPQTFLLTTTALTLTLALPASAETGGTPHPHRHLFELQLAEPGGSDHPHTQGGGDARGTIGGFCDGCDRGGVTLGDAISGGNGNGTAFNGGVSGNYSGTNGCSGDC
jgi:hypothetical protein